MFMLLLNYVYMYNILKFGVWLNYCIKNLGGKIYVFDRSDRRIINLIEWKLLVFILRFLSFFLILC